MAGPRHIWVLVPAAGESRRFREAGYRTPKPLLRIAHPSLRNGRAVEMIEHVVDSLPSDDLPCLTALPAGQELVRGSASERRIHTMEISKTRGQADSIRQMLAWLPKRTLDETAVLIVNCDVVFRDPEQLSWLIKQVEAGFVAATLVIESDNPAMSYAHPYPCPQKFVEKQVLGKHAMAGAWAFSNAARLVPALNWACCQGSTEPYLSHAIGRVIGPKISRKIELSDMIDLGTPLAVKTSGAKIF